MLRNIIYLYKTIFLLLLALMLAGAIILGFMGMINGQTTNDRWLAFAFMIFATLFVLLVAGNLALVLENNELLRRIVDQGENGRASVGTESAGGIRAESKLKRQEPTL